ncbi:hypothetical protein J3A83DRAFT_4186189 [Scleroderma citrinum]
MDVSFSQEMIGSGGRGTPQSAPSAPTPQENSAFSRSMASGSHLFANDFSFTKSNEPFSQGIAGHEGIGQHPPFVQGHSILPMFSDPWQWKGSFGYQSQEGVPSSSNLNPVHLLAEEIKRIHVKLL